MEQFTRGAPTQEASSATLVVKMQSAFLKKSQDWLGSLLFPQAAGIAWPWTTKEMSSLLATTRMASWAEVTHLLLAISSHK